MNIHRHIKYIVKTFTGCNHPIKQLTDTEIKSKVSADLIKNCAYEGGYDYFPINETNDVILHRHYHDSEYGLRHKYYKIYGKYTHIECLECYRPVKFKTITAEFECTGPIGMIPFENQYKLNTKSKFVDDKMCHSSTARTADFEQIWHINDPPLEPFSFKPIAQYILFISFLIIMLKIRIYYINYVDE